MSGRWRRFLGAFDMVLAFDAASVSVTKPALLSCSWFERGREPGSFRCKALRGGDTIPLGVWVPVESAEFHPGVDAPSASDRIGEVGATKIEGNGLSVSPSPSVRLTT